MGLHLVKLYLDSKTSRRISRLTTGKPCSDNFYFNIVIHLFNYRQFLITLIGAIFLLADDTFAALTVVKRCTAVGALLINGHIPRGKIALGIHLTAVEQHFALAVTGQNL